MKRMSVIGVSSSKNKWKQQLQSKNDCLVQGEGLTKRVSAGNNVLIFHHQPYPFNSHSLPQKTSYKTILNSQMTNEQIQRIASMDFPVLVQILKIGKGYQKGSLFAHQQISYSFYYQPIPYSLKKIALLQDYSNPIMTKLLAINLKKELSKLSEYLTSLGIAYCFNLDDIGVTKNGGIKIFVSPLVICESNSKIDSKIIKRSINKIVSWWEITISQSKTILPTSVDIGEADYLNGDYIDKEVSQIIEDQQGESDEHTFGRHSAKKDVEIIKDAYRLKTSNNSYRGQVQKIDQIDRQIKEIRSKLIEKVKIYQSMQKGKHFKSISESQRFQSMPNVQRKRLDDSQGIGQKMHQNINCINIYTQNKEGGRPMIKRIATQPIFSFEINRQKEKPNYSKAFPEFDYYCDSDEKDQSADTYQMELQYQKQSDLFLQNSGSLMMNNNTRKQTKQQFASINAKNKVANNYASGSAGPLQFNSFLNNVINPTLNSKDPIMNTEVYSFPQRKRSQSFIDKNNLSKMNVEVTQKTSRLSNMSSINHFNRIKSLKKAEDIGQTKTAIQKEKQMNILVKNALQKSRKAIALLHRAKKGQSPVKT